MWARHWRYDAPRIFTLFENVVVRKGVDGAVATRSGSHHRSRHASIASGGKHRRRLVENRDCVRTCLVRCPFPIPCYLSHFITSSYPTLFLSKLNIPFQGHRHRQSRHDRPSPRSARRHPTLAVLQSLARSRSGDAYPLRREREREELPRAGEAGRYRRLLGRRGEFETGL